MALMCHIYIAIANDLSFIETVTYFAFKDVYFRLLIKWIAYIIHRIIQSVVGLSSSHFSRTQPTLGESALLPVVLTPFTLR